MNFIRVWFCWFILLGSPCWRWVLGDFISYLAWDLLALVTFHPDIHSHAYNIHMRWSTTSDAHPDTLKPFLKISDIDHPDCRRSQFA
ncbi:hypothetical protein BD769DRAFT_1428472 [Suillus cothurnatus]|nr:hypothetical protein BD769DRAFT_1428472 [Suillus cothurnatus]